MQQQSFQIFAILMILAFVDIVTTKDLRNVKEPKIPPIYTSLKASGKDDTQAIQKALESCAKGKAVALSSGTFYSGPLTIPSGASLLVESGVTLKSIPNPALYDLGAKTCGTLDKYGVGCKAFITIHRADSSGLYGKGTIDGQGNITMTGKTKSWWELSTSALTEHKYQNNPQLVQINNSVDITVYQITLINSPFYTVAAYETNGFTAWGVTIRAPASARNTDGIDPIGCQNVTIAHCDIGIGDDNVAIKALTAPSRHISVLNNHFDRGNGMAIGSEVNYGASDVLVSGLTLNSTVNGIHIKSNSFRGGHVMNIMYENICVSNAQHPIYMDMENMNLHGDRVPEFRNITISNMKALTKGKMVIHGISASNPVVCTLKDVHIAKGSTIVEKYANVTGKLSTDSTGHCGYAGNI